MSDSDLSALIGSRLCHDLVSPLGAIGNGVELLQMTQPSCPELDLVDDAVKMAQARVRLFRLAFGAARPDQMVSASDLGQALEALASSGRITLTNDISGALERPMARRLTLAAMCAETALAWGGSLHITDTDLTAEARRFKLEPELWAPLIDGTQIAHPTSASVHFALLAATGSVDVTQSDDALRIRI